MPDDVTTSPDRNNSGYTAGSEPGSDRPDGPPDATLSVPEPPDSPDIPTPTRGRRP